METNKILLTGIIFIIFFSFFGLIIFLCYKLFKKKESKIKKLLNDPVNKEKAVKILEKRNIRSKKALAFLTYYFPLLGLICIVLGLFVLLYQFEEETTGAAHSGSGCAPPPAGGSGFIPKLIPKCAASMRRIKYLTR
ncbi:MAG: hypothetical protein LBJ31_01835 [Treponema sp.]|jgi:preprotein translocase subunit SecG|nr:hypothetical protein [Treponema sp.]